MSDEWKLLKQRDLGIKAKGLRDDALLSAIFEGLKAKYMRDWAQTEPHDEKSREIAYHQLHALLDVRAQLNAIFMDGKTAAEFLAHAEKNAA